MKQWLEVTGLDDIERQFISYDGTERRTQPFDEVDHFSGGWRVEYMPMRAWLGDVYLPVALSLTAILISTIAIVMRLLA